MVRSSSVTVHSNPTGQPDVPDTAPDPQHGTTDDYGQPKEPLTGRSSNNTTYMDREEFEPPDLLIRRQRRVIRSYSQEFVAWGAWLRQS
jgi:hypothetical protein